jgi:hypothetical protein
MEEMASIEENKTWALVDLPPGHRTIGLKWVYKLKRDEKVVVVKHKACIVTKGYISSQGSTMTRHLLRSHGCSLCGCCSLSQLRGAGLCIKWMSSRHF